MNMLLLPFHETGKKSRVRTLILKNIKLVKVCEIWLGYPY